MNENKTNINWLITIYSRIGENSYKIRAKSTFTNYTFLIKKC